jgi:N5-(carboxyethyl)ornithine synthase
MKTVGMVISHKENEFRRALVPSDIPFIDNKSAIFIEEGYGNILGYSDADYLDKGIGGICNRKDILDKDIICDPKIGDAEYLSDLYGKEIFGWMHAVQNKDITDKIMNGKLTAFAWEDMYDMGRHVFWRNNEIAGEAAIMHAYLRHGIFPYNTNVAILGRGNTARGAMKMLNCIGAKVTVYDRRTEELLRKELSTYDVIINAVLWDTKRNDHIIYKEDLKRMRRGAMIIDISCDRGGAIETSVPCGISNPDYIVDGIRHYVVDHTPSLFYKTVSIDLSCEFVKYIDFIIEDKTRLNVTLDKCMIIKDGLIIDEKIKSYQGRK